ncbi:MAG: hypothetical protein AAGH78_09450 [Cyanobacteria bacterium P01_H01_bin.58]
MMRPNHRISQLERALSPGWAIHVYDYEQRLLFAFNPSHGWALLSGAIVGLMIAGVSLTLTPPRSAVPPTVEPAAMTAPLQLD